MGVLNILGICVFSTAIGLVYSTKDCSNRLDVISAKAWSSLSGFPPEFLHRTSLLSIAPVGDSTQRLSTHVILHTHDLHTYILGNSKYFHLHINGGNPVLRELVELRGYRVTDIRFGPYPGYPFAAILTSDGLIWTAGRNDHGNLGHHNMNDYPVFAKVDGLPSVAKVALGLYHTTVVTNERKLFAWGQNTNNELGFDTNKQAHPTPGEIDIEDNEKPLKHLCCGWGYCAALLGDEVLTWGIGKPSRLGRPAPDSGDWKPSIVRLKKGQPLVDIDQIACGYGHTVALGSSGTMYGWGDSWSGGIANADDWKPYATLLNLSWKTPIEVITGQRTTIFKASDDHTYYMGYYDEMIRRGLATVPDPAYPRDMLAKSDDGPSTWGAVHLDIGTC